MSQENADIVRRVYDAFRNADFETALASLDPAIEWDLTHHDTLEDRRVVRIDHYLEPTEALEAVGLRD